MTDRKFEPEWTTDTIGRVRKMAQTMTLEEIHAALPTNLTVNGVRGRLKRYNITPRRKVGSAHQGTSGLVIPPDDIRVMNRELAESSAETD